MKETSFTVGLQNIAAEDVAKVVRIVEDTLASVVEAGFTPERIAAVLHSYELSLKHRSEIITNSSSVLGKCFFFLHNSCTNDSTIFMYFNKLWKFFVFALTSVMDPKSKYPDPAHKFLSFGF